MADDMIRAAPDSEHQCPATTARGPCPMETMVASDGQRTANCKAHGGAMQLRTLEKGRLFGYRFSKYQGRIKDFATNPGIKSVRAEIGVLKVLLEERINSINDNVQLIAMTGPISELILKINTLIISCDKLEQRQGVSLDKTAVMSYADKILEVIFTNIGALGLDEKDTEKFLTDVPEGIGHVFAPESELDD